MSRLTRRQMLQAAAAAAVGRGIQAYANVSERTIRRTTSDASLQLYTHNPIEVYTNTLSVAAGDELTLHVSTTAKRFNLEIARIGLQAKVVWTRNDLRGAFHPTPDDAWKSGCRWPVSVRVKIPEDWRSGYYQIKAVAADESTQGTESLAFVVVRAVRPTSKILLVLSTNTYGAYNDYGGASLYYKNLNKGVPIGDKSIVPGEHRVSFQRPWMPGFLWKPPSYRGELELTDIKNMDDRYVHTQSGLAGLSFAAGFHNWERVMVWWLEKNGYEADYAINSDLELHPKLLSSYRLMLSVGHDEYWSWSMRDTVESFISNGGNVCFFSGNIAYWQVRYENNGNIMVCYKDDYREDPYFKAGQEHLATTHWSSHYIRRPETQMTGLSFWYAGMARFAGVTPKGVGGYLVYRPEHWVFKDTGLSFGDCLGQASTIVHYEVDGCPIRMDDGLPYPADCYDGPSSLEILGMLPAAKQRLENSGLYELAKEVFGDANHKAVKHVGADRGHAVMSIYTNNGTVFCAGTTDWTSGLEDEDPGVERVTKNLLNRLSA